MKKNRLLSLIVFTAFFSACFGQKKKHKIDSISLLLKQAKSDSLQVRHNLELGILKDTSTPTDAEHHFLEALRLLGDNYTHNDKLKNKALANDCLGIIERRRNNYDKAYKYYLEALRLKEKDKDSIKIGRSLHNIAMLFASRRDYDKALEYMKKALPIRKKDSLNYATSLNNYGNFLYRKKKYTEALNILDSAKAHYGKNIKIADAYTNISKIYRKLGRYDEALKIQKKNLSLYIHNEYHERTAYTLKDIAITLRKLKQHKKAFKYIDSAESMAKRFGNNKLIAILYKERYRISKKEKDYKLALKHYQTYKKYEDSIFSSKQAEKIKLLELDYDYEKRVLTDSINYATQKALLVNTAERQRSQKRLYAILFIVAILALACFYIINRYRRKLYSQNIHKQELEADLLSEKVFFLRYKIERLLVDNKMRTNFNEELSERIKALRSTENSNVLIDEYQSILVQLKNQIQAENRLNDITDTIQKTDQDFDMKLTKQFPELTKSEREVCHLIYLNLSSKEIMNIRNVSISSIKSIRYRIRKKLAVPKGVELELFIQRLP